MDLSQMMNFNKILLLAALLLLTLTGTLANQNNPMPGAADAAAVEVFNSADSANLRGKTDEIDENRQLWSTCNCCGSCVWCRITCTAGNFGW